MSRSAPIFDSGTILTGSGNIAKFIAKIEEKLTEPVSNGEQAWEIAKTISSDYEKVFHSVGNRSLGLGVNKGDTDIWVYLHKRTTDDFECKVAQDYSPTTGVWSSGAYRIANSSDFAVNISDTQAIDWWSVANEYEFVFIWLQGGLYHVLKFGQVIRPYSSKLNGVGRITSQSGTGNGVVFGLDRDIVSNIEVGQYVWLVNQTPDSVAIQSVGVELVEVKAITSNSITVDGVSNTYAVGSLCGLDPAPVYCQNGATSTIHFTSQINGNYTSATGQNATILNPGSNMLQESDFDPGVDQLYYGFQPFVKMGLYPQGFRGKLQHVRVFTLGSQADQDIVRIDFDLNQQWKVFISTNATSFYSWATGYGPGAS